MKKKIIIAVSAIFIIGLICAVEIYPTYIKLKTSDPNDVKPNTTFLNIGQKVSQKEIDELISKRASAGSGIYEYNVTLEGGSTQGGTVFWQDSDYYKINVNYGSSDSLYIVNNGVAYAPISNLVDKGEINNSIGNYEWYETSIDKIWDLESFLIDMKNNIKNARFIKEDSMNNEKIRIYRYNLFIKGNIDQQYNIEFAVNDKGMVKKASVEKIYLPHNYSHFGMMQHDNGDKFVYDITITKSELRNFDSKEFIIPKERIKAAPPIGGQFD